VATSLVISYPDIPFQSSYVAPSATYAEDTPSYNMIAGSRASIAELSTAAASANVIFSLGTTYATKGGKVDHVIIARADKLQTGTSSWTLARGTDGSTFTTETNDASFSSATLYGPNSDDYVKDITLSSAFEWWKFTWTSGSTSKFPTAKLYFGQWFDFGIEPDWYSMQRIPAKEATWYAGSGAYYSARLDVPIYRFTFRWEHVSDTLVNSFQTKLARNAYRCDFFLYTRVQHEVLGNQRLVNVRMTDWSIENNEKSDWNTIEATFEEVLG